ncbi:MAG: hypothetical protein PHV82_13165 [Victivallaceae bacterium]|nr:hypothetical protein [Victivallaceae bacterium]
MPADRLPPLERGLAILKLAAASAEGFTWKQAHALLGEVSTATVTKVLKVLAAGEYLVHENGKYKAGSEINKLIPCRTVRDLLLNQGPVLAKEFSGYIQESCVIAVFDGINFTFTGVQILEGSMGYSPPGMVINKEMGHIMTQLLHVAEDPKTLKFKLEAGGISFGPRGKTPEWEEYDRVLAGGRKNGIFLEYGWRRPHAYRMAIPVFTEDYNLAGVFMCGYSNKTVLLENVNKNFAYYLKVMGKISDYEKIFGAGLKNMGNGKYGYG